MQLKQVTSHFTELKITSTFDAEGSYIELLRRPVENFETPVRIVKWFSVDRDYPQAFTLMIPTFVFDGVLMDLEQIEPAGEETLPTPVRSTEEQEAERIHRWIHIFHPSLPLTSARPASGGCYVASRGPVDDDGMIPLEIEWWKPTSRESVTLLMPALVLENN